jgi:hypothetical protein
MEGSLEPNRDLSEFIASFVARDVRFLIVGVRPITKGAAPSSHGFDAA